MSVDAFASAIVSQDMRDFLDHWRECRGGRSMPGWSDIHPQSIKPVLPYVWAWKYDRKKDRFTGRLAGDQINKVFGATNTGRPLEECFPPRYFDVMYALFKRVVDGPQFFREYGPVYAHLGSSCIGERIALPLADDGVNCDGIIGVTMFELNRPVRSDEVTLVGTTEEWYPLA